MSCIVFTIFRYRYRFQIQSEHLLELQVIKAHGFRSVGPDAPAHFAILLFDDVVRCAVRQHDVEPVLLQSEKCRMGFQIGENGGPRRAVGRDVLGGVPAAEQRGDGRHVQIKNRVGFLELDVHVRQHRTELREVTDVEVYLLHAFADTLPALEHVPEVCHFGTFLGQFILVAHTLMQVSSIWV